VASGPLSVKLSLVAQTTSYAKEITITQRCETETHPNDFTVIL